MIDFAHRSKHLTRPPLILPSITIKPSISTKYLGLILDQNLNWKDQETYVQEKGSKWVAQIHRAARPSWGLTPKATCKIFIGVAIPRILYGVDIWCVPPQDAHAVDKRKGSMHAIHKMSTMQRAGSLAITGGFRTSPTDALNAHTSTLPIHLNVEKLLHRAAVHFASLHNTHPLCKQ